MEFPKRQDKFSQSSQCLHRCSFKKTFFDRTESHGTILKLFKRVCNRKPKTKTKHKQTKNPPSQSCPPNIQFPSLEIVDITIIIPFQEVSLKNSVVQGRSYSWD